MAGVTDPVILAFSCGKDSIGAWLMMRKYFKRIIPYYCYLAPDLSFVEEALRHYEDFFGTEILQLPHPSLYRLLNNLVFQAPENCHIVEEMDLPDINYEDIRRAVVADCGLAADTYVAQGVRTADSVMRRISASKHGVVNIREKKFFPIFDWNKKRLEESFRESGVRLPVDYEMFGRSFDGIDERFLRPIRDRFPGDYKKILEMFPLAELEIKRSDWRRRFYETG